MKKTKLYILIASFIIAISAVFFFNLREKEHKENGSEVKKNTKETKENVK
ncbi:hypothetical protein QWT87_11815 [Chryseobacterium sp. APV1]|uniref:Uncharacterized protein n=2 Tax=Chryseobacterium TaxID=59732 RepID=A0ABT8U3E0_9FLAO|nr:hypothetical protein [Chryseobacterium sp. APV1]MDO3425576.1 hypothetical protein [Chryseobacterium sp. APV1]